MRNRKLPPQVQQVASDTGGDPTAVAAALGIRPPTREERQPLDDAFRRAFAPTLTPARPLAPAVSRPRGHAPQPAANTRQRGSRRASSTRAGPDDSDPHPEPPGLAPRRKSAFTLAGEAAWRFVYDELLDYPEPLTFARFRAANRGTPSRLLCAAFLRLPEDLQAPAWAELRQRIEREREGPS